MSFCHEETAEAVDRRAMGTGRAHAAPAQATARQAGPAVGIEPRVFRGHSMDSPDRRGVAIFAGRVSLALDLLASAQAMGRRRRVAECMARAAGSAG
jgi:hypothetical protein